MGKRKGDDTAAASGVVAAGGSGASPNKDTKAKAEQSAGAGARHADGDEGMGEFEDMWEDDAESEDDGEVVIAPDSDDEDADMQDGEAVVTHDAGDDDEDDKEDVKVYLPGQQMEEDEELVADQSAYEMLHSMNAEWPCLSFDILRDNLGADRTAFPMTAYVVAGSQADKPKDNQIYVLKMSSLHRTKHDGNDGMDDEENEDDLDDDPVLEYRSIPHFGGVNRIRAMPHPEAHIVATMADTGKAHIYDISQHVQALDTPGLIPPRNPDPIHTITQHGKTEGYGIDWSSIQTGHLLTGDSASRIFLTTRTPAKFVTDATPFTGHTSSIEDIQWSPSQANVFATCSADKTIRIWDARDKRKPQLTVVAHDSDVNVISWNRIKFSDHVLASGSESGAFSVWDLRNWPASKSTPAPSASFKWHQGPITSIEWHPVESSMLAVSGADDQVTIWDLALERDQEEEAVMTTGLTGEQVEVPPQLLFIHQGQRNVKEIHWHRQLPGVLASTAYDGFNIFKTINS
ncbi:WD40-repeat-containing domain protein [Entophlyctis helioformis]|nr:WD40-repeat-containing domain protein [Entophlyctis helioformis]